MGSKLIFFALFTLLISCKNNEESVNILDTSINYSQYIAILGIVQDGGFPHINNTSEFEAVNNNILDKELVVSLGIVDLEEHKKFLMEATPDLPQQLAILDANHLKSNTIVDGVFLTHAHMGHYTGLMYFGREAMGSKNINVFAMPRMQSFLENNGPWSQLIYLQNIKTVSYTHLTLPTTPYV